MASLGEIALVSTGQSAPQEKEAFSESGIPFVRAGSLQELVDGGGEDGLEKIHSAVAAKFRLKLFPRNTIVFAKSGMSAKLGRVYKLKQPCYVVSHLAAVEPKDLVSPDYLLRWFEHNPPSRLINNEAYPSIKTSVIANLDVPLPPLPEQRRIAAILDKADAIRRKRQQAIKLANQFLRSVFLDLFGDPAANPKRFPVGTIRDLVDSVNYGSSAKAHPENGDFPILRMGNITYDGQMDYSDLKYIDLSEADKEKYLVRKGDLLFNRTNSKELVGKTAVYDRDDPMVIAGYLIRVRTNADGNPHYISAYINSSHGKKTLRNTCKSIVGMANINAQEFQDIRIMIPPRSLQDKFERLVYAVRQRTAVMTESEEQATGLFYSLSQRAFAGKL